MKQLKNLTAIFLALLLFTFSQCKKKTEEPQLPPETTTGAMTFGCKVNGKVFVPKDGNGRPGLYVQYVNLGTGSGGGWFLNIPALNYQDEPIAGISSTTDSLLLVQGETYEFSRGRGKAKAFYSLDTERGASLYIKGDADTGSLHITFHDVSSRIISGVFYFDGTNENGAIIKITEGRFDLRY